MTQLPDAARTCTNVLREALATMSATPMTTDDAWLTVDLLSQTVASIATIVGRLRRAATTSLSAPGVNSDTREVLSAVIASLRQARAHAAGTRDDLTRAADDLYELRHADRARAVAL